MSNQKRPRTPPLRYFFYRGDLCKKIHIHRPNDTVTAWNYPKARLEQYVYSDVRRNGEKAWSTKQVGEFVNRGQQTLKMLVAAGDIREPQYTYGFENRHKHAWYWSEKDIMDLHAHLSTVHIGRPRNDGKVTPKDMPTASELRAMIRQGTVLYVKQGDKFIPTWRAEL